MPPKKAGNSKKGKKNEDEWIEPVKKPEKKLAKKDEDSELVTQEIEVTQKSTFRFDTLDAIDPSIVHDCKQRFLTVSREVLYETWFLTNRERLNLPFMGKITFYNCFCKCMVTDTERKCVDTTKTTFYSFLDTMKKLHTKPEVRACGCPFHLSVDEVPSAADK